MKTSNKIWIVIVVILAVIYFCGRIEITINRNEDIPQLEESCIWDQQIGDFRCGEDQAPLYPTPSIERKIYADGELICEGDCDKFVYGIWAEGNIKKSIENFRDDISKENLPIDSLALISCGELEFRTTASDALKEIEKDWIFGYQRVEFFQICQKGTISTKFMPASTPAPTPTPTGNIFTRDELPVKNWPYHEQFYACNEQERQDPKTSYPWELSLPLKAENSLYHSDPWTVAQENGVFTLSSQDTNAVFEVRSDQYVVEVPTGAGVYRINFTTKVCETDWLFVILPKENPLDFPIVVILK